MKKPVPIFFLILSVLYFIFLVNMGATRMIADDLGGDPGNTFLPMFVAVVMMVSSVYLLFKEKGTEPVLKEGWEFYLTLGLSVVYIVLIRPVGFLLMTQFLIFTLTYIYVRGMSFSRLPSYLRDCLTGLSLVFLLYAGNRFTTRALIIYGRQLDIPLLSSTMSLVVVNLVLFALLTFLFHRGLRAVYRTSGQSSIQQIILSASTSMILYVVFRQMFNVSLVPGLLWF